MPRTGDVYYWTLPNGQCLELRDERLLVGRLPHEMTGHPSWRDFLRRLATCSDGRILLPDPFVSRQHALLTRTAEGSYAIEDAGSRCGTFVNGEAISTRTTLQAGDRLTIGQLVILHTDEYPLEPSDWTGCD